MVFGDEIVSGHEFLIAAHGNPLKLNSQSELPGTISAILGSLHILHLSERRRRDIRRRRREVWMIKQVRESSLKAHANPLGNSQPLGQPYGDGAGTRPFQYAYAAISDRPQRDGTESIDVEHTACRRIRAVPVASAIRALKGATIGKIKVSWIEARTCRRSEI